MNLWAKREITVFVITTHEVHTYKNEYQKNVIKDIFGCHFLFQICLIVAANLLQQKHAPEAVVRDILQNSGSLKLRKTYEFCKMFKETVFPYVMIRI